MNLCSNKHEEICYENEPCPVCEKMIEINDLQEEITFLKKEISNA